MDLSSNRFVSRLSRTDQAALKAACRATVLRTDEILSSPFQQSSSVYFPTGAVVVHLVGNTELDRIAVGLSGYAEVIGLHLALGETGGDSTALVQSQGMAWSIDGGVLKRMASVRMPMLLAIAKHLWSETEARARYVGDLQRQSVTQRLARWIVQSRGPQPGSPLELTHIHLAAMLGVRRASVSTAAVELREQGLLDYARGKISVLDWKGLEIVARSYRRAGANE